MTEADTASTIAVVGRACRFPGASSVEQFWANITGKVESVQRYSAAELTARGVPSGQLDRPEYVRAGVELPGIEDFDADFFGYAPREAAVTDPQQRLLLECGHEALENAGHVPSRFDGDIGVFVGTTASTYLIHHLLGNPDLLDALGMHQLMVANDKAFAATRLSYKLGLTGPSMSIDTACSTSLVAVHCACQSLLSFESDLVLAGGVSLVLPQGVGYLHAEGGVLSAEGHCRPFDADADGTVLGAGVGIVVLRRLADALADGDTVYALIRGTAVTNDGRARAGFAAPGVDGQARAIVSALEVAQVSAATIGYVEAHGTGTAVGDPIEVAALTAAFRTHTDATGFCALGSVKANVGHLDAAAGVCGLIKAVEAVRRGVIPPVTNFRRPNPSIDFPATPFRLPAEAEDWPGDGPRRAGVSSFGLGGTNAHVIVESPSCPEPAVPAGPGSGPQVVVVSAETEAALAAAVGDLAGHLAATPGLGLRDAAGTTRAGRQERRWRQAVVASDPAEAAARLPAVTNGEAHRGRAPDTPPRLVFMFPGQGPQYPGMLAELYASEPAYREAFSRCAEAAAPALGLDLADLLYGDRGTRCDAEQLRRTNLAQPAVVAVEYGLAALLRSWGVEPDALIGYSLGEYTAAVLAGVLSIEDAMTAVCARGALMDRMPPGRMLSVPLPAGQLRPLLGDCVLAAVNTPDMCVAAGEPPAIAALEERLRRAGTPSRMLKVPHAYHSPMMEPTAEPYRAVLAGMAMRPPDRPMAANLTGGMLGPADIDPDYWVRHLTGMVNFAGGLGAIAEGGPVAWLEVGPGQSTTALAKQVAETGVFASDHPKRPGLAGLREALAGLWTCGVAIDWDRAGLPAGRRIALPTYPFQRQRHWIDPVGIAPAAAAPAATAPAAAAPVRKTLPVREWLYRPAFSPAPPPQPWPEPRACRCLVFADGPLGEAVSSALRESGCEVMTVRQGAAFARDTADAYVLPADDGAAYAALCEDLAARGSEPDAIAYLWPAECEPPAAGWPPAAFERLLRLGQAVANMPGTRPVHLLTITTDLWAVGDGNALRPDLGVALGPARVLAQDIPHLTSSVLDIHGGDAAQDPGAVAGRIAAELTAACPDRAVALRGTRRYLQTFERFAAPAEEPAAFRRGGTYLLTGAFGGLGRIVARHLARRWSARLVLIGRLRDGQGSWPPDRQEFAAELERLGAQVQVAVADVTDRQQLASAIENARRRFGHIDGVVHAAGVADGGIAQLRSVESTAQVLRPKVIGARLLEELLAADKPELTVYFSSLAGVLGGFAHIDYAAANAFLDASAEAQRAWPGGRVVSVAWSHWRDIGMVAKLPAGLMDEWTAQAAGIDESDGIEALELALAGPGGHVLVSPADLSSRMADMVTLEARVAAEFGETTGRAGPGHRGQTEQGRRGRPLGRAEIEERLCAVWRDVLGVEDVDPDRNFFDLGGNSLLLIQAHRQVKADLAVSVPIAALFRHPTIRGLAGYLVGADTSAPPARAAARPAAAAVGPPSSGIAVVGMAGRFPGARDVETLWDNLVTGREAIRRDGTSVPQNAHPLFVPAVSSLDDIDRWDAGFFGCTPREAELTDPQQRLAVECAHEALEQAGWPGPESGIRVGVFGGTASSGYLFSNLLPALSGSLEGAVDGLRLAIGNDKDYLTTQISYRLNLTGPSVNVNTACSTSLVAVHLACESILRGECELALAGGVRIDVGGPPGYLYQEGGLQSPDGYCRAFDARGLGTVLGSGVGFVALKPLDAALADGDLVHAVILGSAINNDGAAKVGYTAPSVSGQAQAIRAALARSGADATSIGYVEAHGTGTALGDPVEIAALGEAFGGGGQREQPCLIGSVKTNLGHLDAAAGIAGLIKAVLTVKNGVIPPSLHFTEPNPQIDFAAAGFRVADRLTPWPNGDAPRRAGISSFGVGGTNAHVVIEQPPRVTPSGPGRRWQVLPLSAQTSTALSVSAGQLADALAVAAPTAGEAEAACLADVATTLQTARRHRRHRLAVVADSFAGAARAMREPAPELIAAAHADGPRQVAFLFPGQGSQRPGMFGSLLAAERAFAEAVSACAELAAPFTGWDLRRRLAPDAEGLDRTDIAQPVLFAVEYGLARLFGSWGVTPAALAGHSVGEYAAAVLAGVLSLEDAVRLVCRRGELMRQQEPGAMLSVALAEDALTPLLPAGCVIAAVNAPDLCVVSGPPAAVAALRAELRLRRVPATALPAELAFHSPLMSGAADAFREEIRTAALHPPSIPVAVNATGRTADGHQLADPEYWVRHIVSPVRFGPALAELGEDPATILLTLGPTAQLAALARRAVPGLGQRVIAVDSDKAPDDHGAARAVAALWTLGVPIDWPALHRGETRTRIPLPGHPLHRSQYWIGPGPAAAAAPPAPASATAAPAGALRPPGTWCSVPRWAERALPSDGTACPAETRWIVHAPGADTARETIAALRRAGRDPELIITDDPGAEQVTVPADADVIILGLWPHGGHKDSDELMALISLVGDFAGRPGNATVTVCAAVPGVHGFGDSPVDPARALLMGPCRVLPQESPAVRCSIIDVTADRLASASTAAALIAEAEAGAPDWAVVRRGERRFTLDLEPIDLGAPPDDAVPTPLRGNGVYLITGGLGGCGLAMAEYLAATVKARLVLFARRKLPEGPARQEWLASHRGDDPTVRILRSIERIEAAGGQALVLSGDVAAPGELDAAAERARAAFGHVDGFLHAAGVPGGGLAVLRSREAVDAVLAPKVAGTRQVIAAAERAGADFVALFSSTTAITGAVGQVDYAAANAYLDACATAHGRIGGPRVLSLGWHTWRGAGMAVDASLPPDLEFLRDLSSAEGMDPGDACAVLGRVLASGAGPHVVISPAELGPRLRPPQARPGSGESASAAPAPAALPAKTYPRPELSVPYTAASTDIERDLAAILERVLGVSPVGVHDDFLELGGHSLLAVRVIHEVEEMFGIALPLRQMFESPTVRRIADAIVAALVADHDPEQLAALVDAIEEQAPDAAANPDPAADGARDTKEQDV